METRLPPFAIDWRTDTRKVAKYYPKTREDRKTWKGSHSYTTTVVESNFRTSTRSAYSRSDSLHPTSSNVQRGNGTYKGEDSIWLFNKGQPSVITIEWLFRSWHSFCDILLKKNETFLHYWWHTEAFLQIKISPEVRPSPVVVCRKNIVQYRFTRVAFGLAQAHKS